MKETSEIKKYKAIDFFCGGGVRFQLPGSCDGKRNEVSSWRSGFAGDNRTGFRDRKWRQKSRLDHS